MGWTSCPPSLCGGQDARPTRWNNLFLGNPLSLKAEPLCLKVAPLKPKFPAHLLTILSSPILYAQCPMPHPLYIYMNRENA
ncbi:hypothetical protein [Tolypothrix sp. PCC 7601]|uniref:hypothetical protein n=1 Tax=Tolypothrix sp. PCC 7601 TaxID=1188 RepID=UPI001439907B|nr:hypothetical protein [Tolypothrix sp. PCC 7601]UYD36262.1 hypothetical protein HG267_11265 [Tolypothrix sp. PCC 7601]